MRLYNESLYNESLYKDNTYRRFIETNVTIPSDREIVIQLFIGRTDGVTYKEVTDWLTDASVNLGDFSTLGTGNSGADSVVRQLEFTLHNDEDTNFAPKDKDADINNFNGSYAPLLFPMREAIFRIAIQDSYDYEFESGTTQKIKELVGTADGSQTTFSTYRSPLLIDSEKVYVDGKEQPTQYYTVNNDTGDITFDTAPSSGDVEVTYTYFADLFGGYIDTVEPQPKDGTISVVCRDYAKRMQYSYIEDTYKFGSDSGTNAATVIQNIIDDNMETPKPTVYNPDSIPLAVRTDEVNFKTVWDATQDIITQSGWFFGYRYDIEAEEWQLKILNPPRDKTTADYELTATDDIYKQDLSIDDEDIRNAVKVRYQSTDTGSQSSVTATDQTSIDSYGRRPMELANLSQIDTSSEANDLANAALEDLKDINAKTNIDMPIMPEMDLWDTFNLTYPEMSSTTDFFAVDSVRHHISIGSGGSGTFRTEVQATGKVIGGQNKWLKMQTRPGASKPIEGANILFKNYDVIIAASNSRFQAKNNVDYICDGVADQEQINDALDFLNQGRIRLLEGKFIINGSILFSDSSKIKFVGDGFSSEIYIADQSTSFNAIKINEAETTKNELLTIRDIAINGNKANQSNSQNGLYLIGNSEKINIDNLLIENISHNGVEGDDGTFTEFSDVKIKNSIIRNNANVGISFRATRSELTNNIIENNGTGVYFDNYSSGSCQITGNKIMNNNEAGIQVSFFNEDTIANNNISYNGEHGIEVSVVVSGDTISSMTIKGNKLINNSLNANDTYSNIYTTIELGGGLIKDNVVKRGNNSNQPKYGIRIGGANNIVTGNDMRNGGVTANFQDDGTGTITSAGNAT